LPVIVYFSIKFRSAKRSLHMESTKSATKVPPGRQGQEGRNPIGNATRRAVQAVRNRTLPFHCSLTFSQNWLRHRLRISISRTGRFLQQMGCLFSQKRPHTDRHNFDIATRDFFFQRAGVLDREVQLPRRGALPPPRQLAQHRSINSI